jgi:hypothetical protein
MEAVRSCLSDEDVSVYETACETLHRLQIARNVIDLVEAFRTEANPARRWVLLDAALDTGDLGDKHRPAPKWLQRMCADLPYLTVNYVEECLKERRDKVAGEVKQADDQNGD